jgi:GIY-YIG catalytic domain
MFRLNDLLRENGIPPDETVILLHTPGEGKLARLLPFLAEAEPEVLEAYQSVHSSRATATLRKRAYMVSFVRTESGRLALAGVFRNRGVLDRPTVEICAIPAMRRVIDEFGANAVLEAKDVETWPYFDFERLPALSEYVGRVEIAPRLTRAYARLAESLDAEIVAFSPTSVLASSPPDWRNFVVTGPELRALPPSWAARLREWRGVYMIVDEVDGARYVGAAYGEMNLFGRWQEHVANDVGVTAQLRKRDTRTFRFSILERVSPDATAEDVIALEHNWMDRLHTRQYGLNA